MRKIKLISNFVRMLAMDKQQLLNLYEDRKKRKKKNKRNVRKMIIKKKKLGEGCSQDLPNRLIFASVEPSLFVALQT